MENTGPQKLGLPGVDQLEISKKVSKLGTYILSQAGTHRPVEEFAQELFGMAKEQFTDEERTYLAMMYVSSNIMRALQQNDIMAAMFPQAAAAARQAENRPFTGNKTSPDENA